MTMRYIVALVILASCAEGYATTSTAPLLAQQLRAGVEHDHDHDSAACAIASAACAIASAASANASAACANASAACANASAACADASTLTTFNRWLQRQADGGRNRGGCCVCRSAANGYASVKCWMTSLHSSLHCMISVCSAS